VSARSSASDASLSNLVNTLLAAFQSQGGSETLEEAIELYLEALFLRPSGHTFRSKSVNNLSIGLLLSFEQQGGSEVLAEAITLNCEGLYLTPPGHKLTDPRQSAFVLGDGELAIYDLMTLNLEDASLAYLCACQTAIGDERQPDPAVHLAASMLSCGFKSVIGIIGQFDCTNLYTTQLSPAAGRWPMWASRDVFSAWMMFRSKKPRTRDPWCS
jgi:hypothetical protein